jgi:hypothetical protein
MTADSYIDGGTFQQWGKIRSHPATDKKGFK